MLKIIKKYIASGNQRSIIAKKNIIVSFVIKFISIAIGFIYVPLILDYLDATRYGIWLTLSSIVTWFGFFDVGLGNGLRNNFAEAIANGDHKLAREYVSTTYFILATVFSVIIVIFLIINPFLNWANILNADSSLAGELSILSLITFIFFLLRFIFKLIGQILMADQKTAINNSFGPIGNIINLFIIIGLTHFYKGSLLALGAVLSITPVLVLLGASLYFYKTSYRIYAPSIKYINFKHRKKLLHLGFKFFIIQISGIVLISSTNFILTKLFNPESVTIYNIARKYFGLFIMGYSIILSPIWSAITEAFIKQEFDWIKKTIKKLQLLGGFASLGVIIALIVANKFYELWLGGSIIIPLEVSIVIAIQTILFLLFTPYVIFLNGVSKIKLTLILVVFQTIAYIPLAIYLGKIAGLGIIGVLIAGTICEIPIRITQPIQYYKIVNGKAKGIWNE